MSISISWVTILGIILYFTGALAGLADLIQQWLPEVGA
jgi:hypothetical protein